MKEFFEAVGLVVLIAALVAVCIFVPVFMCAYAWRLGTAQ